jgi:hypothetical protein
MLTPQQVRVAKGNLWGQACTMVLSNAGTRTWLRYNSKVPLYKPDPKDCPNLLLNETLRMNDLAGNAKFFKKCAKNDCSNKAQWLKYLLYYERFQ